MTELTKKEFVQQLKEICPVTDTAAKMWCRWSAELEETDRAGEDYPEWDYKTAAQFRGELIRMFTEIKTRFGEAVAGQVASLGDVPHCLYPWEIVPAAEHLHKGGALKELPDMSIEGSLDGVEEYLEMKL